jgi:hypothetical protein
MIIIISDGLLQVFTHVTLQMSSASQPTIPFVLPMYEQMDRHLLSSSTDDKLAPVLRKAALVGRAKLLKYKTPAQANHYYRMGTSMSSLH